MKNIKHAAAPSATDNRLSLLTIASSQITAYLTRKQRRYFDYESAKKCIIRLLFEQCISHTPKDANIYWVQMISFGYKVKLDT